MLVKLEVSCGKMGNVLSPDQIRALSAKYQVTEDVVKLTWEVSKNSLKYPEEFETNVKTMIEIINGSVWFGNEEGWREKHGSVLDGLFA